MKLIKLMPIFLLITALSYANDIGMGLTVGSNTGFNLKLGLQSGNKLAFHTSYSDEEFTLIGDYLIKKNNFIDVYPGFYGLGLKVSDHKEDKVAIRTPIGLLFYAADFKNIEFFMDVAPHIYIIEETEFDIDFELGFTYYFK